MNRKMNVVWGEDFFDSLSSLPKQVKLRALTLCNNLMQGKAGSNGLHFETLRNALDKSFRSVRLDDTYRVILSEQDKSYILLWADHHDRAYDWARNRRLNVNMVSGALELKEVKKIEVIQELPVVKPAAAKESPPLLQHITREQLQELLPVDDTLLERIHSYRDADSLLADAQELQERLGRSGVDILLSLAGGDDYDTVKAAYPKAASIDPDDIDTAVDNAASQMSFFKFDNEKDMQVAFEYPLDKWRLFLHPDQRVLVEKDFSGPVRVTGGAGTGKTVAAMHRARHLAQFLIQTKSKGKVLFTTFTKNLALDIESNLAKLCEPAEMDRIEVVNLDAWAYQRLLQHQIRVKLSFTPQAMGAAATAWKEALDTLPDDSSRPHGMTDLEIRREWERVIQANGVDSLDEYYRTSRAGRRIRLRKQDKEALWRVFEEYRALLKEQGIMEPEDMYAAVEGLVEENPGITAGYEYVIVDEAQDFGNAAFRLIARITAHRSTEVNSLYITGDAHQRIYGRKVVLSRCGINVRGRSRRLRVNYRTTEETRRWATAVLDNRPVDDLDNGTDTLKGYRSLTRGVPPQLLAFRDSAEEIAGIAGEVRKLQQKTGEPAGICIVVRTGDMVETYRKGLVCHGIQADVIEPNKKAGESKVCRIATFHRVKGLEFDYMILAGMDEITWQADMQDDDSVQQARCLIHVAATRARKRVLITASPALATFINVAEGQYLVNDQESTSYIPDMHPIGLQTDMQVKKR